MDPGIITIIIAIAGATGTILSFVVGRRERAASANAAEATAASHLSESYKKLVDSLETRVQRLEAENIELKTENMRLKGEVAALRKDKNSLERRIERLENGLTNGNSE